MPSPPHNAVPRPLPRYSHTGTIREVISAALLNSLHIESSGSPPTFAGRLDLGNSALRIDYGSGPSPDAEVRAYLQSGLLSSAGISSSLVAADPSRFALGYADGTDGVVSGLAPGEELVRLTVPGDVTLNGLVDFADLLILAQHYGTGGGAKWDQGDLNYDGRVDFADLLLLGQHYGQSLGAQQTPQGQSAESRFATVPEPATDGLFLISAAALARRRLRRA